MRDRDQIINNRIDSNTCIMHDAELITLLAIGIKAVQIKAQKKIARVEGNRSIAFQGIIPQPFQPHVIMGMIEYSLIKRKVDRPYNKPHRRFAEHLTKYAAHNTLNAGFHIIDSNICDIDEQLADVFITRIGAAALQ